MSLEVPEEEGTHDCGNYEVTVEEKEFNREVSGYDAHLVFEDNHVNVYEDKDGDYWVEHKRRPDTHSEEGPTLVTSGNDELYDALDSLAE
jgi:hypothetical protein